MRNKIVGIVVFMLVATAVVSATNIDLKKNIQTIASRDILSFNNKIETYQPVDFNWGMFNWGVDQKQTKTDRYGITLYPPDTNAQSFTPTKDKLTAVSLYIFRFGAPPEPVQITVSIRDNLSGSDLATKTIDTSVVKINKSTWVLFDFEDIPVAPGNKYYIVCQGTAGNPTNAYCWLYSFNDTYPRGDAWYKANEGSSWIQWPNGPQSPKDFCFKTYFRKPLDISSVPQTIPSTPLTGMKMIDTTVLAVDSSQNGEINTMIPSTPQTCMVGGWSETQKLLASDGQTGDTFGYTLDFDGDTAIITSYQDDDNGAMSGSAYVFTRSGTNWTQQQKLLPSDGAAGDNFGWWADIDGDTAIITAPRNTNENGFEAGAAYIFTRSGTTWTQQAKLIASDGQAEDHFGYNCALLGDTAFIGANWDDDNGDGSGSMYVFTRSGTTWTQQQKLLASDGQAGDRFGGFIALSDDTALIGTYWDDDNGVDSGSMYVFTRSGTTWTQQAKVLASDGAAGDTFGSWISLEGDTAFVGAWSDDDLGVDSGSVYVFTRSGTAWTEQQKIHAEDGAAGDNFGGNLDFDGDTLLIAAMMDDDKGTNSGSAYIFTRTGTTWTQQQKLLASDGATNDQFGVVSLDGNTALIGAWYDDDMGTNSGSVYVFTKSGADLTFSIKGGIGVKVEITNNGTSAANDIPWQIHVEGGMLGMINKTVNGTIDIPAGETVTVKTGMLLGFGAISISAKVADEEQTATGTQIIIFSMVKK